MNGENIMCLEWWMEKFTHPYFSSVRDFHSYEERENFTITSHILAWIPKICIKNISKFGNYSEKAFNVRQQLKKMVFGKLTKCSLGPFHQQRWNGYSTSAGDTSKGGITIPPLLVITSRGGITIPPLLVIFSPKNAIRYGIFRPLVVILSFHSLHRNAYCIPLPNILKEKTHW